MRPAGPPYTVDASVFLNALLERETGSRDSRQFVRHMTGREIPLVCPTLVLPEIAGALRRGTGDAELARDTADTFARLPGLVLVPLSEVLAREAAALAADHALRGADAVYLAVCLRYGGTLVTLDREQRTRAPENVTAVEPAEALAG